MAWGIKVKTVKAKCSGCDRMFDKKIAEYHRAERLGKRHFCSRSCSASLGNVEFHRGGICNFKGKRGAFRDNHTPFRWFLARARSRMVKYDGRSPNWKRDTDIDITAEYLEDIWHKQNGCCDFTGDKISLPHSTAGWKEGDKWHRASLDRIDNARGYVVGNVRFVSLEVNLMRNGFSDEEFVRVCMAVSERH